MLYLIRSADFIRTIFGILCSLVTLTVLTHVHPFSSPHVFHVAVISGTCTCLKYALSFLLMVPEAVTTFTIPWEGTEKDLGNGISIMFMTIDFIAFGCAMFMASKIIQRTKKALKSEHAGMSLEEIEEERMRQRMRYEKQQMAEEVKAQKRTIHVHGKEHN